MCGAVGSSPTDSRSCGPPPRGVIGDWAVIMTFGMFVYILMNKRGIWSQIDCYGGAPRNHNNYYILFNVRNLTVSIFQKYALKIQNLGSNQQTEYLHVINLYLTLARIRPIS